MNQLGKVVATIECRMTSTRLPGKVLKEICGKPVLELMVERLKRVKIVDEIILATTVNKTDDPIVELAKKLNVTCFRGSEPNVLKRVADAAKASNADTVLCLTGDCPLTDWNILSQLLETYRYNTGKRAECNHPSKELYPNGLGAHIISMKDLEFAGNDAKTKDEQEHVVIYFRKRPETYPCIYLPPQPQILRPDIQITLDEPSDFELIKNIYEHFYFERPDFTSEDIIKYIDSNPELSKLVKDVKRIDSSILN